MWLLVYSNWCKNWWSSPDPYQDLCNRYACSNSGSGALEVLNWPPLPARASPGAAKKAGKKVAAAKKGTAASPAAKKKAATKTTPAKKRAVPEEEEHEEEEEDGEDDYEYEDDEYLPSDGLFPTVTF